jgi:tRNA nucleotidyltransferase (CCA-adding enzyme)
MFKIPRVLKEFASHMIRAGYGCYLVGGAVRDMLLKRKFTDYDVATEARPDAVMKIYRRVIPTGIKHGTVTVLFKGIQVEVTTFRTESDYTDGRRPSRVTFSPSILEDLKRRDFTINAMAYDLAGGGLLDPHDGRGDLRRGIIRAIGDPGERFSEDGLRPVRACRFAAQFNFKIEEHTFQSIPKALETVKQVSAERIRDELIRMLEAEKPSVGLQALHDSGLLALILPELEQAVGVEQRELHCFDVFEHLIYSCDAASADSLDLRLSALFHDIGKPGTLSSDADGLAHFFGHEELSARLAEQILLRLRFPNETIRTVTHLVRQHMFNYSEDWSDAAVRRFVARAGEAYIPALLALRRADQVGTCNRREVPHMLIAFEKRIEKVLAAAGALTLSSLKINGRDLMRRLALPPGPQVGLVLNYLLEAVLDDPSLNETTTLLTLAERFYEQRLKQS